MRVSSRWKKATISTHQVMCAQSEWPNQDLSLSVAASGIGAGKACEVTRTVPMITYAVPSVVTKDGTFRNTVMAPLTKPTAAAISSASPMAGRIGTE